jgi:hypothetical protein
MPPNIRIGGPDKSVLAGPINEIRFHPGVIVQNEIVASNNICIGNGSIASSAIVNNEITIGNTTTEKLRLPGLTLVDVSGTKYLPIEINGVVYNILLNN